VPCDFLGPTGEGTIRGQGNTTQSIFAGDDFFDESFVNGPNENVGGGLFGVNTAGGLFGNEPAALPSNGGIFGAAPAMSGGGLFGSDGGRGYEMSGGGLFGGDVPAQSGGGLFGHPPQPPQDSR
jgi:nuclear pore complex protein Nup98-Nup96